MPNFSHLTKHSLKGRTARMKLYALDGEPALIMLSALNDNEAYTNAMLKRSGRAQVRRMQRQGITKSMIDEFREHDRELYPRHVIVGWEGVIDADNHAVPFSREACEEFLRALPDYIMDEVKEFANNPGNFTSESVDEEELAKN